MKEVPVRSGRILQSVLRILFLSLILFPLQTAQAADAVAIQEIFARPGDYDVKEITLVPPMPLE